MMQKRLLIQTQLSNYDTNGFFILACDSGWQMMLGRVREILKLVPDIQIDILMPKRKTLLTQPEQITPDLFKTGQVHLIEIDILPNALATRYDFNFEEISNKLVFDHKEYGKYTHVFINDPMLLRNYKALFMLQAKYRPKFICHSHFIDNVESPKFPQEASLWFGQMEAAYKADVNFFQCESAMNIFFESASKWLTQEKLDEIKAKSWPWDDGYSHDEMSSPINFDNIRFDLEKFIEDTQGKTILFVPNRVGGSYKGQYRSSDYTNCGKFLFEIMPELWKCRQDFVVIAGNPNQKFTNDEVAELCPAYYKLVDDAFNRDEYKMLCRVGHDISVSLYSMDAFGGTSNRELLDLGSIPLMTNCNEYADIAKNVDWPQELMINSDLSNALEVTNRLIEFVKESIELGYLERWKDLFSNEVYRRSAYESTTLEACKIMGLI
jgi:hypothetical protein